MFIALCYTVDVNFEALCSSTVYVKKHVIFAIIFKTDKRLMVVDLSGSVPSLKTTPERIKSAPMTGRGSSISSRTALAATHRPNNGRRPRSTTIGFSSSK